MYLTWLHRCLIHFLSRSCEARPIWNDCYHWSNINVNALRHQELISQTDKYQAKKKMKVWPLFFLQKQKDLVDCQVLLANKLLAASSVMTCHPALVYLHKLSWWKRAWFTISFISMSKGYFKFNVNTSNKMARSQRACEEAKFNAAGKPPFKYIHQVNELCGVMA